MSVTDQSATSADVQPQKRVKTRRTHRKVRTGCVTCKIRRKKCDETKPSCVRCTSTGRKCDGYEQIPATAYEYETEHELPLIADSRISRRGTGAVCRRSKLGHSQSISAQLVPRLFTSEIDLQCFDYFRLVTAQQLGNYHDSSIWRNFVVRAALTHPVVLKATAALGAAHRRHDLGISREAFQYCEIANRLDKEAVQALAHFERYETHQMYSKEILMMAKMLRGVFLTIQGDYELAAADMADGLAALWDRPLTSLGSHTLKYGTKLHPHIFMELFRKMGRHAAQLMGRKYIILTDHKTGKLPPIPFSFPSLQHGLDLLYTQIDHLYNIPTSIWRQPRKRQEAQILHVQYLMRFNAALAETTSLMGERTPEQIQSCFLLRRIRSTTYLLVYLVLYLQSDTKRKYMDFEGLKGDILTEGNANPLTNVPDTTPINPTVITVNGPIFDDPEPSESPESDSEPVITSPALWTIVNHDEDLLTNISGIMYLVDISFGEFSIYNQIPRTMSMNIDSGIGPPRSSVAKPTSSAKVRHLIRSLMDPSCLDKIYKETYAGYGSHLPPPDNQGSVIKSSYGSLYNIAESVCALEEHAVFAAARRSQIVPKGVQPRWFDITCFLEERKMLIRYCCRDQVTGAAGPTVGSCGLRNGSSSDRA